MPPSTRPSEFETLMLSEGEDGGPYPGLQEVLLLFDSVTQEAHLELLPLLGNLFGTTCSLTMFFL